MAATVMVVEDEAPIQALIAHHLSQAGHEVLLAASAEEAGEKLREGRPDLILLDWMLPGASGIDFARRLKNAPATRDIPIIMLTARGDEADRVRGLETGADDYVTKPFSPRELVARVKAVLRRRAPHTTDEPVECAGLRLDPASHRVTAHGRPVPLGPTEFRLLHFLMTHPERVHTRSQLLDQVWGSGVYVEERTVDVHILRLRRALEASGHDRLVQTVRGAGYRFSEKPEAV